MLDSDWWTTRELSLSTAHLSDNVHKPCFHFKMANIMMKTQQDKMALIFLIVDVFGNLNMQIYVGFFSSECTDVIGFSFRHIVQTLSVKYTLVHCEKTFADYFSPITFKLNTGKKF